jgi:predicted PurR-regulated permease PerM
VFSLDDRTGNVVTTLIVFAVAICALYAARGVLLLLLLSVLFAYLLEPMVGFAERRVPQVKGHRSRAIAMVYLAGILVAASFVYAVSPSLVAQAKKLNATVPALLDELTSPTIQTDSASQEGPSSPHRPPIQALLIRHREFLRNLLQRVGTTMASMGAQAMWLLAVPILAIFLLNDRAQIIARLVDLAGRRGGQKLATGVVEEIDTMLARYIRAQLALSGLSCAFYTISMLTLGIPYAIALGVIGGALEFLPAVGWIATAAAILTVGFLTHAHWIWMAALLGIWGSRSTTSSRLASWATPYSCSP